MGHIFNRFPHSQYLSSNLVCSYIIVPLVSFLNLYFAKRNSTSGFQEQIPGTLNHLFYITPLRQNGMLRLLFSHLNAMYWQLLQVQTPQQRKANSKFSKDIEKKMGKPTQDVKKKQEFKSPVSPFWLGTFVHPSVRCSWIGLRWHSLLTRRLFLGVLGFVVFGGLVFELLSRFFMWMEGQV